MNEGNSNQQWQQHVHQHQDHLPAEKQRLVKLSHEAVQKAHTLNKLMMISAQKHAANELFRQQIAMAKQMMENALSMKNEIGKTCNSIPRWAKKTKEDLAKITDVIQSAQRVTEEIRQLELELVQLPTDDDLQKYPMKMRELQQEIDNRNKIIKEMEDKMNGGGDTDDYEDELMRSSAEMEEVISSSPEQSKRSERSESSDEEPTGRDMFQSKKGEKKADFMAKYFNIERFKTKGASTVTSSKMDSVVTSTKAVPGDECSIPTKLHLGAGD